MGKKKKNWENVPKPPKLRKKLDEVSLGKDKDGYFVYTHRARSPSYPSPDKIPLAKIKFISSTGSVDNMRQMYSSFLVKLADQLDQEGKSGQADAIDEDFEEFLKLLEDGKLLFHETHSMGPRDPRGPYGNLGRGPLPAVGIPGPQ